MAEVCPFVGVEDGIQMKEANLSVKKFSFGSFKVTPIKCSLNLKLQHVRLSDFRIQTSRSVMFLMRLVLLLASCSELTV